MTAVAAPRFFSADPEPVMPGFERIAHTAGFVAEHVLDVDYEVSPSNQSLIDENGGESL